MESKPIDFKSTVVAAVVGAVVLFFFAMLWAKQEQRTVIGTGQAIGFGGALGAIVQIMVRLTGVS